MVTNLKKGGINFFVNKRSLIFFFENRTEFEPHTAVIHCRIERIDWLFSKFRFCIGCEDFFDVRKKILHFLGKNTNFENFHFPVDYSDFASDAAKFYSKYFCTISWWKKNKVFSKLVTNIILKNSTNLPVSVTGWATTNSPGSALGNLWIESDVAQTVNSKPHFKFKSDIDGSDIHKVVDHF